LENPYQDLSTEAFWKLAVALKDYSEIENVWNPKFHLKQSDSLITYGSCFSQNVGWALRSKGFKWLITEPSPYGLSATSKKSFSYDLFSSRTGNIYTTSLLKQWISWSINPRLVPDEIWTANDRFFDPFRPTIEPNGFASKEELLQSRKNTLVAFKQSILRADYMVFTLGLSEGWINSTHNYEYPMCPGTAAGSFDKTEHEFFNQSFTEILRNLKISLNHMRKLNSKLKVILTVSPVPITATMTGKHVLTANSGSKSTLRAVCEELYRELDFVDYFPAYDIVQSPNSKGKFYKENWRNISPEGISFVMNNFLQSLENKFGKYPNVDLSTPATNDDEICDEEILQAFAK
jgi:hypothetical protein